MRAPQRAFAAQSLFVRAMVREVQTAQAAKFHAAKVAHQCADLQHRLLACAIREHRIGDQCPGNARADDQHIAIDGRVQRGIAAQQSVFCQPPGMAVVEVDGLLR